MSVERIRRGGALLAAALLLACGSDREGPLRYDGPIARVLEDPGAFDGRRVRVRAWYVESLGRRVLSDGLGESYPPQAVEPSVWLTGERPEGDCLVSDIGVTWGRVEAEGRFRYEEEGAFGPFAVWTMTIEQARLSCL